MRHNLDHFADDDMQLIRREVHRPAAIGARRRITGFTLVELIVAMALFAILSALVVPGMRLWINNAKIRATADAMQNGLRLAQTEALRRSRQVVFYQTSTQVNQNSAAPVAVANGSTWVAYTLPALVGESSAFIGSGTLNGPTSGVTVNASVSTLCFNSIGRLITLASTSVTINGVTTALTCTAPSTGNPPMITFNLLQTPAITGAKSLNVEVALGGQVRMCDPQFSISSNSQGC